jgi:hypothetical protein
MENNRKGRVKRNKNECKNIQKVFKSYITEEKDLKSITNHYSFLSP